jgi:hypothetical protein
MGSLKASPKRPSSHNVPFLSHIVPFRTLIEIGSINRIVLATSLLLMVVLTLSSDPGTVARILDKVLVDWIPSAFIPLYTASVILYLSLRYLHDGDVQRKKQEIASASATVSTPPSLTPTSAVPTETGPPSPIDLSGCYNLIENHNFEGLLQAQGVPWLLASAANKARPIHRISHDGCHVNIKIEGIIESETMYIVDGPPVETIIRGRLFRDQMTYMTRSDSIWDQDNQENTDAAANTSLADDGFSSCDPNSRIVGIQTHKRAVDDGYTILVQRRLSDDKNQIILTSRVQFDENNKADVQSRQIFQRYE